MNRAVIALTALTLPLLSSQVTHAEVPNLVAVHGVISDLDGVPLDGDVDLTLSLYGGAFDANPLWTEQRVGDDQVTLTKGYFSIYLGEVEPLDPALLSAAPELWLALKVGDDDEMTRIRFPSVPFAFVAQDVRGDIHPRSITIGGNPVIDASGKWVGQTSGVEGPQGPAGESVTATALEVGDANCPQGGTRFQVGQAVTFACTGAAGPQGQTGGTGPQGPAGPDNITTITAGAGLTGGGSTTTVALGLADLGVTTAKLANTAVTDTKLAANAVTTTKVADLAVTDAKLAANAVTTTKIADLAVTDAKLAANAVTTTKIADLAVTESKLANNAVTTTKLADSSVTTAKINNLAVTTAKLADSSVTTAKIADASVTPAKTKLPAQSLKGTTSDGGTTWFATPTVPLTTDDSCYVAVTATTAYNSSFRVRPVMRLGTNIVGLDDYGHAATVSSSGANSSFYGSAASATAVITPTAAGNWQIGCEIPGNSSTTVNCSLSWFCQ